MNSNPSLLLDPVFRWLDDLIRDYGLYIYMVCVWLSPQLIALILKGGLLAKATLSAIHRHDVARHSAATVTNSYEWDAANRLTAFTAGTNRSEFAYDGLGRRAQIVEKQNGSVVSTKKFVWCGPELCEERDSTGGTVTKRFFSQGEQISGTNYFFTRDHLGSVREMIDGTGMIVPYNK